MERNWDLIREILIRLETSDSTTANLSASDFDNYPVDVVSYHFHLLNQAGLIEATNTRTMDNPIRYNVKRLTWEGHEFLDSIKSQTVWDRIKSFLSEKGVGMSVEAVKLAVPLVLKMILGS